MKTLDELLEKWTVLSPYSWENENSKTLGHWYAVANDSGIVAYFGNESDALAFRLDKINTELNRK